LAFAGNSDNTLVAITPYGREFNFLQTCPEYCACRSGPVKHVELLPLRIEVHDKKPVIGTLLVRVKDDAGAAGIKRDPVRLLPNIEGGAAHLTRMFGLGDIKHC